MSRDIVANRVFIAYPWKTYRGIWESMLTDLHKKYPLHFMAIGREPGQPAAQLLAKIVDSLERSSIALLDASTGNPNVSLEYGYSKACLPEGASYLFLDEDSSIPTGQGAPIISDLAGNIANRYRIGDHRLREAVEAIARRHAYTKRFVKFCRRRKYKGGTRRFLLRILRQFDGRESVLRRELLDDLVHESRKSEGYVEEYLRELHAAGLVTITRGNEFSSRVAVSG